MAANSNQTYPPRPAKRLPYWSCDWGNCDKHTVGWRFVGVGWLAVCEEHFRAGRDEVAKEWLVRVRA